MRKLLVTAVALAPLAFAAAASAQTVVNSNRTAPIATATADDGQPDDIVVEAAGGFTLDSGAAITLNSDNDVTLNNGSDITMDESADGSTGVLAQGGFAGSISNGGAIRVADDLTPDDDNDDGNIDGPFAEGENRFGIRLTGPGALDGNVTHGRAGSITVEGNESGGISLESDVTGDFNSFGSVNIVGDDSESIRSTGAIGGSSRIGGAVNAVGENSVGVAYDGSVTGQVLIDATVTSTGFRYSQRPSEEAVENLDEDDLLIGGSAVRIAGDVGGGVVLDIAPAPPSEDDEEEDDEDEANADRDNDGVPDVQEGTATITSIGSAPALAIGSSAQSITLGVAGTGDDAYGLINRGNVLGTGIYDGVTASALVIAGGTGQTVTIDGGVRNEGSLTANAIEASGAAVVIGAGASTPLLSNTGVISSTVTAQGDFTASGVVIQQGAALPALVNSGGIQGAVSGGASDAFAIRDLSGTLSDIENSGAISAQIGLANTDQPNTGATVAIDVSANTTGVSIIQFGRLAGEDSTAPDTDGDGVADANEPRIVGDIRLGSGADTLDIRNGAVIGDMAFGAGADSLQITGGAEVFGSVTDTDGQLQIDVTDGRLDARQTATTTTLTGLTVGEDGTLIVGLDPTDPERPAFNVNGSTVFEDGSALGVSFQSLVGQDEDVSYLVIRSDTLDFGDIDQESIDDNSPYIFITDVNADEVAGEVYVDVRRRTADEADFIAAEAAAYDSIYAAIDDDQELLGLFLSQTDRDGFINLYEQFLPDHSGGPLLALASGVDAVTRALSGRNQNARPGETSAWVQEINFYAEKDQDQAYGFESEGFGIAGGIERGTSMGAFGVTTAFTSTDLEDPQAQAEELLSVSLIELGLYWRAQGQNWTTWARAAGGYASLDATRQFVGGNGVFRSNESDWDGFTIAAAAGASYERNFGRYSVRPEFTAEYFSLSESSRTESGGGDGFDLGIDDRDSHLFAATAVLNLGMGFGENRWLRPELRIGWKQNISFDGGTTQGRFLSGGPDFLLQSDAIEGGGPVIGFRMNVGNDLGFVSIEGDAELMDDYVRYALLLRASFKF